MWNQGGRGGFNQYPQQGGGFNQYPQQGGFNQVPQQGFNQVPQQQGWNVQQQQGFNVQPQYQQGFNVQPQYQQGFQQNMFVPGQVYVISSAMDRTKVVDISQGGKTPKGSIVLWSRNNQPNQKFVLSPGNGGYQILSAMNQNITIQPNPSRQNGQLYMNTRQNTPNEYWQIVPAQGGGFHIKYGSIALDLSGEKTHDGTPILQYAFNGHRNQVWFFEPTS